MHPWKSLNIWLDGWRLDLDGKAIGYRAAHHRVGAKRGPAWAETCVDCRGQAEEWSYDGLDLDEIESPEGLTYSLDPDRYAARCKPCHRAFDLAARERKRGEGQDDNALALQWIETYWRMRQKPREARGLPDDPVSDVRSLLGTMIEPQTEADLDLVTLWIAATHLTARGIGWSIPRLAIVASSHGAGKSTLLRYVARLSHNGERLSGALTAATIPRAIQAAGCATICLDEIEKTLKSSDTAVTTIINDGWERDAEKRQNEPSPDGGWISNKVSIFSPLAMAGNGLVIADDVAERFVTARLARSDNPADTDWERINPILDRLKERLAAWADHAKGDGRVKRPPLPEGLTGRNRDRWKILLSVGQGVRGRWITKAEGMAMTDVRERAAEAATIGAAPNEQLAWDLVTAWPADGNGERVPRIATTALLERLIRTNSELWGPMASRPLTSTGLAWRLKQFYGIRPTRWRDETGNPRGYTLDEIRKAWKAQGIERAAT